LQAACPKWPQAETTGLTHRLRKRHLPSQWVVFVMPMYDVGDGSQVNQVAVQIESNTSISSILRLLKHQKELKDAGFARRVSPKQPGDLPTLKIGCLPRFEVFET
jgi:hypothetical protein